MSRQTVLLSQRFVYSFRMFRELGSVSWVAGSVADRGWPFTSRISHKLCHPIVELEADTRWTVGPANQISSSSTAGISFYQVCFHEAGSLQIHLLATARKTGANWSAYHSNHISHAGDAEDGTQQQQLGTLGKSCRSRNLISARMRLITAALHPERHFRAAHTSNRVPLLYGRALLFGAKARHKAAQHTLLQVIYQLACSFLLLGLAET